VIWKPAGLGGLLAAIDSNAVASGTVAKAGAVVFFFIFVSPFLPPSGQSLNHCLPFNTATFGVFVAISFFLFGGFSWGEMPRLSVFISLYLAVFQ
jgi:hypothetical protein